MAPVHLPATAIRRTVAAAVVCVLCAAFVATGSPSRAQDTELADGGLDLALFALLFVDQENVESVLETFPIAPFAWSEIDQPTAYNPFRFPVTYDDRAVDSVTIGGTFAGAVNLGDMPAMLPFDPSEVVLFGSDRTQVDPPSSEIPPFTGEPIDLGEALQRAQVQLGYPDDEIDTHFRITSDVPPMGPVLMLGARTVGPRMVDCVGLIREYGTVFDTSGMNWDESTGANPQQFNDFFFNGDTAIIDRCTDGTSDPMTRQLTFENPFSNQPFIETAGTATMVSGQYGWMMFVPLDSVPEVTGFRFIDFVTDIMAPYNPDYTVASAAPADLAELIDVTSVPAFAHDPALNVPETTTTTSSSTTTTTLAVAPPSSEATTTTVVASGPVDVSTGGPIWWMIVTGFGLFALGIWFWWQNGNPFATATAASGGSTVTTAPPPAVGTDTGTPTTLAGGTAVLVPPPDRPGKGEGGGDDSPPKIGLRGWKV